IIYNVLSIMTLALSLLLTVYVYVSDKKNKVNETFAFLVLSAFFWILTNFFVDISSDLSNISVWSKLTLVGPIFIAFFFYRMSLFFPKPKQPTFLFQIVIWIAIAGLLFFVPTRFNIANVFILPNGIPAIEPGPLYGYFLVYFLILIVAALTNLFRGYRTFEHLERQQVNYISLGVGLSIVFGSITNLILPLLGNSDLVNFGPYFILIFIILSSYALIKYHLFDIKILTTQLFVFSLCIFTFLRMLLGEDIQEKVTNGSLFVLVAIFGWFLIKSVIREVHQREKIEELAKDLSETNDRQEKLIHFIGHEVKGYLTKGEYAFSEMAEGDFGTLPPETKVLATTALAELRKGVASVTDILQAANLKRGTVAYDMKPVDLKDLVKEEVIKTGPQADEKKLALEVSMDESQPYTVNLDRGQFGEHVIRNLIDNSIKYTPQGNIMIKLARAGDKIVFSVKDTGVGISDEDRARLFTEGGRGKDSMKVNVHSTGYGLYIAKQIVEAHSGKIWVESEGPGKGSTFFVEFKVS